MVQKIKIKQIAEVIVDNIKAEEESAGIDHSNKLGEVKGPLASVD